MRETQIDIDTFHPKGPIQPGMGEQIFDFEKRLLDHGYNTDFMLIQFPTHPKGFIQLGDVDKILDFEISLLYKGIKYDTEYEQTSPTGLIRNFQLRRPKGSQNKSWIPWDELQGPLLTRVEMANECQKRILNRYRYNPKTGQSDFSPVDIQRIFTSEYRSIIRSSGNIEERSDFDLHDVYVCVEAAVFEFCSDREKYPTHSEAYQKANEKLLQKYQSLLKVVGQALSEPLKT